MEAQECLCGSEAFLGLRSCCESRGGALFRPLGRRWRFDPAGVASSKTLANRWIRPAPPIDHAKNREPHATDAKTKTSTDAAYQIPEVGKSRDGTFLTD